MIAERGLDCVRTNREWSGKVWVDDLVYLGIELFLISLSGCEKTRFEAFAETDLSSAVPFQAVIVKPFALEDDAVVPAPIALPTSALS
jgi:hypothetical protein